MNPLLDFYNNQPIKDAVHNYLIDYIKQQAVDRTFTGKDITGLKESKDYIEQAFSELDNAFGTKKKPRTTNQAR